MSASSYYSSRYYPYYGRLNGNRGDGWCAARKRETTDWLQVDLAKTTEVCGVATQGDINGSEWTIDFKLSFSADGLSWTTYLDIDGF